MSPTIDDAHLLTAWQHQHDTDAFRALCDRHISLVEAACRRQGSPDVAEAVQAVFLVLAGRAGSVSGASLGGWLTTTVHRVVGHQHRSAANRRRHEQEAAMEQARQRAADDADPTWEEARHHLDAALASLSTGRREAILRFYLAGRPQAEVAAELGCSVAAVKIRVHEGLEGLRKFFARKGIALGAVALASGLASEATASEPTLVATCVQTVLTPGAAPGAAALAHGVISAMIIKTATLAAAGLVLVGSCLTAALVVGAEPVPPVTQPATLPVTQTMPALQLTAASMNVSMAPDRPSAMVEPRIVYEAVRLNCSRLNYSLAALAGVPRPVLSTANFLGGPDDRVYFDSSASLLPQMAFKGVMRPRTLNVRRAEPDPAHPDEVRFRAEAIDLNEVAGIFDTPAGPRRHAARADRAILMFVCAIDAKASNGLGNPRMEALHIYGRSQPERRATILRLKPGAPPEPSQVDPIIAAHTYEMRASGAVISIYFDAAGQMQNIEGVEDFESDGLVPIRGPNRPAIKK